jgi:hypothetical protein
MIQRIRGRGSIHRRKWFTEARGGVRQRRPMLVFAPSPPIFTIASVLDMDEIASFPMIHEGGLACENTWVV